VDGFVLKKDQTLISNLILVTQIQNGDQKLRWQEMDTFSLENRLERHQTANFKTLLVCKIW
jgi:hypothetical protein